MARIATFLRLPGARKALAVEATLALMQARLLVWRRGEHEALRTTGELITGVAAPPTSRDADAAVAREVAWAISVVPRALRRHHRCLVEALGAARLLTRRSVPWLLKVGVAPGRGAPLAAHAWLIAGGRIVTGRAESTGFSELQVYRDRA